MTETDESLAARAKAGDRPAFENLVRRHKAGVFGLCRRYVGGADEAYDLVQEAFASAWIGLPRYDERRPFIAWLRTIALNKCRDFGRRRSVRRLFLTAFAREQASPSSRLIEPPAFATDDRLNRLDHEIAHLPTACKEALLLTALGGLNHQDAAVELGISVKAVEMRVYRAKRRLAARLNVNAGSDGEGG